MNLLASPPTFAPAPQPEVTSITGAPLLQADGAGDTAYLAYDAAPGGPIASWSASTPNAFSLAPAADVVTDLTTSTDGSLFAMRANNTTELRGFDLVLASTPTSAELESIPNRVAVPGVTLHPTGALLYDPFLDGPPPSTPRRLAFTAASTFATLTVVSFDSVCTFLNHSPCWIVISMACTEGS